VIATIESTFRRVNSRPLNVARTTYVWHKRGACGIIAELCKTLLSHPWLPWDPRVGW